MKTIIFDFDGTLADSLDVIIEIFSQLTGKANQYSKHELAGLRHLPIPVVAERLGVPIWRVPFLLYRGRRMMAQHIDEVKPYGGMQEALAELHKAGFTMLIASSNSTHNVRMFLRQYNLDTYFTRVYGGIGLFSKSAALRKLITRNRLLPADSVYVGDESRDIEACQAIGLRCIAVEWGFADPVFLAGHHPHALVKHPSELVSSIKATLQD